MPHLPRRHAHAAAAAPAPPRAARSRFGRRRRVKDVRRDDEQQARPKPPRLHEPPRRGAPDLPAGPLVAADRHRRSSSIYLLLFVVLNTKHVKVSFVFASTRVSLIWVILLSLAVGIVLGVLRLAATPPPDAAQPLSARDALGDLVGRDEAEGEPQRARLAAEVGALHERDACLLRAGQQLAPRRRRRSRARGSSRPRAASCARPAARGRARRASRRAARRSSPTHALEVRLEEAAADELVHRRLAEQHGRDVRRRSPSPRSRARARSGNTNQPTRRPGAIVFEKEEL